MRWWISKPWSVTARTLDSAAFLPLNFYLALSLHNFFYIFQDRSFCFSLPPYLSTIAPHLSPVNSASISIFTHLSPPHLAWAWSDRPPGSHPRLLASTARLSFPPLMYSPSSFVFDTEKSSVFFHNKIYF